MKESLSTCPLSPMAHRCIVSALQKAISEHHLGLEMDMGRKLQKIKLCENCPFITVRHLRHILMRAFQEDKSDPFRR